MDTGGRGQNHLEGSFPVGDYSGKRFLFANEKNHQTRRCDRNRKGHVFRGNGNRLGKTGL